MLKKNYKELAVNAFFVLLLIYVLLSRRACASRSVVRGANDQLYLNEYRIYMEIDQVTRDTNNQFIYQNEIEHVIEIWESDSNVFHDEEFVSSITPSALISDGTLLNSGDMRACTATGYTSKEKKLIYYTRWDRNRRTSNGLVLPGNNRYLQYGETGTLTINVVGDAQVKTEVFPLDYEYQSSGTTPPDWNVDARVKVGNKLYLKMTTLLLDSSSRAQTKPSVSNVSNEVSVTGAIVSSSPLQPTIKSFNITPEGMDPISTSTSESAKIVVTIIKGDSSGYYTGAVGNLIDGAYAVGSTRKMPDTYHEPDDPVSDVPGTNVERRMLTPVANLILIASSMDSDDLFTTLNPPEHNFPTALPPGAPKYKVSQITDGLDTASIDSDMSAAPVISTIPSGSSRTFRCKTYDLDTYFKSQYSLNDPLVDPSPLLDTTPDWIKKVVNLFFTDLADKDDYGGYFICRHAWITEADTSGNKVRNAYCMGFPLAQKSTNYAATTGNHDENDTYRNDSNGAIFMEFAGVKKRVYTKRVNWFSGRYAYDFVASTIKGGFYDNTNDPGPWKTIDHFRYYDDTILSDIHKGYTFYKTYEHTAAQ